MVSNLGTGLSTSANSRGLLTVGDCKAKRDFSQTAVCHLAGCVGRPPSISVGPEPDAVFQQSGKGAETEGITLTVMDQQIAAQPDWFQASAQSLDRGAYTMFRSTPTSALVHVLSDIGGHKRPGMVFGEGSQHFHGSGWQV